MALPVLLLQELGVKNTVAVKPPVDVTLTVCVAVQLLASVIVTE